MLLEELVMKQVDPVKPFLALRQSRVLIGNLLPTYRQLIANLSPTTPHGFRQPALVSGKQEEMVAGQSVRTLKRKKY